jgi:RNA binding exosome subunit
MKILSDSDIEALVNKPLKKEFLRQARLHEQWLRFFSSYISYLDQIPSQYNDAAALFFQKYSGIIGFGTKKYERLIQVFENELPNIIESISDGYSPIYTASDRIVEMMFSDEDTALKFESLREKTLQDYKFMSTQSHSYITEAINTIIVVDKDKDGEPYFLPVNIDDVISYKLKFNKNIAYVPYSVEYIVFRRGE